jgi:hypothetical protein
MYYEIEDERAWNRARARAHERVYVAQLGSSATDQSDIDIAALIAKLHRWTATLQAELDKRIAYQAHMDEVSADMEAADLEQQEQT